MPTLTIKNIPSTLYNQLKKSAQIHRRSINQQAITWIEQKVRSQGVNIQNVLTKARAFREKTQSYPISDEDFNQAKREGRL